MDGRTNARGSMTAALIFEELSKVGRWAQQPRKMRWAAARYYSGADSLEQLRSLAEADKVLTQDQVNEIIMLR